MHEADVEAIAEALDDLVMSKGIALDEVRLDWLTEWVATREAAARLDGRCASCGEPATITSRPNGRLALVCLRHFNVWQTPAALRGDA